MQSLPQGFKKAFIVAGDASAVQVYDSDSYKLRGEVKVSIDADSIAYDSASHTFTSSMGAGGAYTVFVD